MEISEKTRKILLTMQEGEITEYFIYQKIASFVKDEKNCTILKKIGEEERVHAEIWEKITGVKVKPNKLLILFFYLSCQSFRIYICSEVNGKG